MYKSTCTPISRCPQIGYRNPNPWVLASRNNTPPRLTVGLVLVLPKGKKKSLIHHNISTTYRPVLHGITQFPDVLVRTRLPHILVLEALLVCKGSLFDCWLVVGVTLARLLAFSEGRDCGWWYTS